VLPRGMCNQSLPAARPLSNTLASQTLQGHKIARWVSTGQVEHQGLWAQGCSTGAVLVLAAVGSLHNAGSVRRSRVSQ
jgi:hypothetical protein